MNLFTIVFQSQSRSNKQKIDTNKSKQTAERSSV